MKKLNLIKNSKLLIVLFSALLVLLSGCNVEGYQIRPAQEFCKEKGGIHTYLNFSPDSVTCSNGDIEDVATIFNDAN